MRNDLLTQRGATECFTKAGLAEGTSAAKFKTAAPNGAGTDYAIDGICYHKADTDDLSFTAHAQQAAKTKCIYLIQIDKDGTLSSKKGNEELTANLTAGKVVLHWPEPDDDKCPIGAVKIETANTATFTANTTDLSATDITDTWYDFAGGMPQAPLTS